MVITSRLIVALLISTFCVFGIGSAAAQEYPTKPIRVIVPNTPGIPSDLLPRIMGPEMTKVLGQPIVVENRPGAGGIIGYEYVAKQAPADGYTLIFGADLNLAMYPVLVKELRFDPLRDLPPILSLTEGRLILVSSAKLPWKTFNEIVAYAKANPGKLNYGRAGPSGQIQMEILKQELGLDIVHIPFNSNAPYIAALVSGDVQTGITTATEGAIQKEKLRVFAITGDQRSPLFPGVPTFDEVGHPNVRSYAYMINVRAGTPKAVTDKLYAAALRALRTPEVKAQIENLKLEVVERSAEAAAKSLADQGKLYADIAKKVGIQPE